VGARGIAQYVGDDNEFLEPLSYYAGIVAEEAREEAKFLTEVFKSRTIPCVFRPRLRQGQVLHVYAGKILSNKISN
jgi:hypothetical protein